MTTRAISADTARKTALEDSEMKIKSAFRRGLLATCEIAKELHKIYHQELYTVKTPDFSEYVTTCLNINQTTYRRIIAVKQTVDQLQEDGLELPANESQAAELARLDPPLRSRVWNDLVIRAEREEKTLTLEDVRRAVEIATEVIPHEPRRTSDPDATASVEVDMEMDDNNGSQPRKKAVQEGQLILTEKGEAALNRIRKVCGDEFATAIEDGTKAMTERDIKNWAEYDDAMMRQLVFFMFDQGYPLSKAVNFITREIDDSTDVRDLILIASSRGGSAQINFGNRAKITVELVTGAPK
jgi:hypothetical protein